VHQPVYYALAGVAKKYGESNNLVSLLVMALGPGASLGIASASWYFFESQLLTLKQRFQSRVRPA
jgi:peptidoglycan/LPS O-acetylase OafA/YrhL